MERNPTLSETGKSPARQEKPFSDKPIMVFWETTRACLLSCVHCRASAIKEPLPGELTTEEGLRLIDQVASFGSPSPIMVFTGGDPLLRKDLFQLLSHAADLGVRFALSPAVTELLSYDALKKIKASGVSAVSISLDGARAETHDSIRRIDGTYQRTVQAMRDAVSLGLNIQVNTAIMKSNYSELPQLFHLIRTLGVRTWELFFLVKVGRGTGVEDLAPEEVESVCNFLYDASFYGLMVRTVEAPFIRRVAKQRQETGDYWQDEGYLGLRRELLRMEGPPVNHSTIGPKGTLDGDGILFVGYDGGISPGGLVPVSIGNVKKDSLVSVYRDSGLLRSIRSRRMSGPCGMCSFIEMCGGSRARAYAYHQDPLSSDPACFYGSGGHT